MSDVEKLYVPHIGWMSYETSDVVGQGIHEGHFEGLEQAFFFLYLRPGDHFLDCGAHVGLFSVLAGGLVGKQHPPIVLEPDPDTCRILVSNLKANGISAEAVLAKGVFGKPGRVRFARIGSGGSAYSHVEFDGENRAEGREKETVREVEVVTLTQIAAEFGVDRFDLVKLDVEGSEPSVIGSLDTVQSNRLFPLIMVEFTETNLGRAGSSSVKLFELLRSRGYQVCRFDFDKRSLIPTEIRDRIDYENFFATTELELVNRRLRAASSQYVDVATDIYLRKLSWERFADEKLKVIQEQTRYIEKLKSLATECARLTGIIKEQDAYIAELKRQLNEELRHGIEG